MLDIGKSQKTLNYVLNGNKYVIPAGFKFDGASIPKFLHPFLSPQVGVLLIGGLVHDYAYKYATLLRQGKKKPWVLLLKRKQTKSLEILISA